MPSQSFTVPISVVALACVAAFGAAGCARGRARATVPVASAPAAPSPDVERPMTTAPDTDATPPVETEIEPPAITTADAPPEPLVIAPAAPPAPRRHPEERAAQADEQPVEHPAPQISPQISPTDQSMYAKRTADDIAAAESNLQQTSGKHLNAAQQDLADKIRSFVAQSRDASKGGDWDRAQNLAQKARLLSNELLHSL